MPNIKETISSVREKWKSISILESSKTKYESLKKSLSSRKSKAIIIGSITGMLAIGISSFYYYEANAVTLYHVSVDGKEIGIVSNTGIIEEWKKNQLAKAQSEYGIDKLNVTNKVSYTEEIKFKGKFDDNAALKSLQNLFEVKAKGVALVVDGKEVGYVKDKETAERILSEIKDSYKPVKEKSSVSVSSVDESSSKYERKLESVEIKESVVIEDKEIEPAKVSSEEAMLSLLKKGTLEEKVYEVQEGDTISEIAYMHNLSTDQLFQLNPQIEGELIHIGDQLNVTALTPLVTVETKETVKNIATIDYKIEYKNDSSMFRNEKKVIQSGEEGKKEVTYEVVKQNGITVTKEILGETVLKEPVTKIIKQGTKIAPSRGSGSYAWPTMGGIITSPYGSRWGSFHAGLDISGVTDRTIKAADSGVVVQAGWNGGYGNSILIDHGNGVKTRYGHMSSLSVSVGDRVGKGQKIGIMGTTGNSTGVHLHFEVIVNGSTRNPLNYVGR